MHDSNDPGRTPGIASLILVVTLATACGLIIRDDVKKYDAAHNGALSNPPKPTANLEKASGIVPMKCDVEKTSLEFANSVTLDLFSRPLNEQEKAEVIKPDFDRDKFVDASLANPESANGVTRFVSNLLRLNNIVPIDSEDNEELLKDAVLVADLQKEPIELVLRNIDKPWPEMFTIKDIYCTKNTAPLYNVPEFESGAFVSCTLPDDRAGLLGLASVLRANPSSVYDTNNNYHRVAVALYLAQGIKLLESTNGPTGEGQGIPLPACVPATDTRVDGNGLIFGTASVPIVGPVCASCHSTHNGPLSIAFRRFDELGRQISFEMIDNLDNDELNGASRDLIKTLINEVDSCWSFNKNAPARTYKGIPGLGRLIAESGTLGDALSIQIPQNMGNIEPDANMSSTIKKYYKENGKTLKGAMQGYFKSDSFKCSVKGE